MAHLFDRFECVILGDSEFNADPGELYKPVAYAWKNWRTGETGALRSDELGAAPPHPHGKTTLFVGFTAAEPEFFGSIGWPFEMAMLDLRVEHINLTNFAERKLVTKDGVKIPRPRKPRSLIDILQSYGITDGDAAYKKTIRDRIIKGPPFTAEEWQAILKYCLSDVLLLEMLLEKLLPQIRHLGQAVARGESVKLSAEIFCLGQPADPWAAGYLRQPTIRRALRFQAVANTGLTHGLWQGPKLTQVRLNAFLARHSIKNWRTTPTGRLGTADRDFVRLAESRPDLASIAEINKTVRQLREFRMIAGRDNRYRTPLWVFSTITSRMAPDGAAYPFTVPAWGRPTLCPPPGWCLAYLDFASMEFGVAAALSQCATMLEDYEDEPYLLLPILAGLVPAEATRHTHPDLRDKWKPLILALQYGGGAGLLAYRLGVTRQEAQRVVDLHRDRYSRYWEWSDRQLERAFEEGELIAPDGWRCGISAVRTNEFTARNWLIQAISQAIFRYGGLMMRELSIQICAIVHDANLIQAKTGRIEEEAARATLCLQRASRRFLHGTTLRVDAKILKEGERFTDKRGDAVWSFVERTFREIEEGGINVSEIDVA